MERAKAQGIPQKMWSRLQKGETLEHEGRILTPDMVLGEPRRGLSVDILHGYQAGAGDCGVRKGQRICLSARACTEKTEKAAKAREYKHMTFQEAARLGRGGCAQGDVADPLQPVPDQAGGVSG